MKQEDSRLASINKQRQTIISLISFDATLSIIGEIKARVKALSDIFKQYGITQLGKQLQHLRYEQCMRTSALDRERLARECYNIVYALRRKKHEHRKRIKEEGQTLKMLYAQLFDVLDAHNTLSKVENACKSLVSLLEELYAFDPCVFYKAHDPLDAVGVVQVLSMPFLFRLCILSLFSTDALLQAYAGELLKAKKVS